MKIVRAIFALKVNNYNIYRVAQKVSHYQVSSLNMIKNRH